MKRIRQVTSRMNNYKYISEAKKNKINWFEASFIIMISRKLIVKNVSQLHVCVSAWSGLSDIVDNRVQMDGFV